RVLGSSRLKRRLWRIFHPMPPHPAGWARELYAQLRALDQQGLDGLLIEAPPSGADWQAVSDRLTRAASAHTAFRF
ncbi:Sua5 family C-terminal domain-containing protein, partial [Acidithiobacillus thiooxidans]|uniref:Sua5 family C-terminal domain-containing protein n=1 Tax=Acidithiobacillus thiooxidans TaxID=930 RepID=UPI0026DF74FE